MASAVSTGRTGEGDDKGSGRYNNRDAVQHSDTSKS